VRRSECAARQGSPTDDSEISFQLRGGFAVQADGGERSGWHEARPHSATASASIGVRDLPGLFSPRRRAPCHQLGSGM